MDGIRFYIRESVIKSLHSLTPNQRDALVASAQLFIFHRDRIVDPDNVKIGDEPLREITLSFPFKEGEQVVVKGYTDDGLFLDNVEAKVLKVLPIRLFIATDHCHAWVGSHLCMKKEGGNDRA